MSSAIFIFESDSIPSTVTSWIYRILLLHQFQLSPQVFQRDATWRNNILPCDPCTRPTGLASDKAFACETDGTAHAPRVCDRGYRCNTTSNVATRCPAGTSDYRQGVSLATPCPACPKGYFNPLTAQTFCPFQCPPGTYGLYEGATNDTTCGACPIGHYCAGNAVVNPEPCPAGTYLSTTGASSASSCVKCGMGKYSSVVAAISSSTCATCPAARPNSAAGAKGESECTSSLVCPSNQQVSADGTTCVSGCENGKYSVPTTNECQNCPVGTFNTDGFASGCQTCPFGFKAETEGLSACIQCSTPTNCPVGTLSALTREQRRIRSGIEIQQYGNTEALAKPPIHCDEDEGAEYDILLYSMFGISSFILIFHSILIKAFMRCIACCVKKEVSRVKILNRLDQLQSEWGSWEGDEVDSQIIVPPKPSPFGAAYTLAFLPIGMYTVYQLVMANNPKCSAGLQVLSANRLMGQWWKIELPTVDKCMHYV